MFGSVRTCILLPLFNFALCVAFRDAVHVMVQRRQKVALYPFQNYTLSWDARVDDLISRLTLDEIVNQTFAEYGIYFVFCVRLWYSIAVFMKECLRQIPVKTKLNKRVTVSCERRMSCENPFLAGIRVLRFPNRKLKHELYQ